MSGATGAMATLAGVAVVCAATAAWFVRVERSKAADAEARFAALEKRLAALEARPAAPAKQDDAGKARPTPVDSESAAPSKSDEERLKKIERQVAKLSERMKELSRASSEELDREIAGATSEDIWEKMLFAKKDGASERAHKLLKEFTKRFPGDPHVPEAKLGLALDEINGKDWPEAVPILQELLRDHPDSPEAAQAMVYLGMSRAAAGDAAGAIKYYEDALPRFDGQPYWQAMADYHLASAYEGAGNAESAREYWKKTAAFSDTPDAKAMADEAAAKLKGK